MSIFAPHIWGFSARDAEFRIARESGWSRWDLMWERLMEKALGNWTNGFPATSQFQFRMASLVARCKFVENDLRNATSLVNLAAICSLRQRKNRARSLQKQALSIWQCAESQVDQMTIGPRARSSLFHLRMEVKHRDRFQQNMRDRIKAIANETRETIECLDSASDSGHRHFSRWKGEKPPVYDDTRKILAACLLIMDR